MWPWYRCPLNIFFIFFFFVFYFLLQCFKKKWHWLDGPINVTFRVWAPLDFSSQSRWSQNVQSTVQKEPHIWTMWAPPGTAFFLLVHPNGQNSIPIKNKVDGVWWCLWSSSSNSLDSTWWVESTQPSLVSYKILGSIVHFLGLNHVGHHPATTGPSDGRPWCRVGAARNGKIMCVRLRVTRVMGWV